MIKPVIVNGKEVPGYFVSDKGEVFTSYKVSPTGFNNQFVKNLTEELIQIRGTKKEKKIAFKISVSIGFFDDYEHSHTSNSSVQIEKGGHQLVMEAFRPIDQHPPERLKHVWNQVPEEAKRWIRDTVIINHIDHNPHNNDVNNLEYVTQKENVYKAVKFYGGHLSNKRMCKQKKEVKQEIITICDFL
jgi:hypothetical protein